MTLGLIWTVILRFVIAGLSEEGMSAKQGLLLWCQKKTQPYKPKVHIENFTSSWQDGLGFCALIHRHRPDLISMEGRDSSTAVQNLTDAFEIAERDLGIAKLLDVSDLVDVARPDEKSVMTYVAQYYRYFSSLDKNEIFGKRISNFLMFQKEIGDLQHDYEERTRILQGEANEKSEEFHQSTVSEDYNATINHITQFREYRKSKRREFIKERDDLASLFNTINFKLISHGLNPYTPPHGLSVDDTANVLDNLAAAEATRRTALYSKLREIQERVQKHFAQLANTFHDTCTSFKSVILGLQGSLESQLQTVVDNHSKLEHLDSELPQLQEAEEEQTRCSVEVNIYTDHTTDDLTFELEQLNKLYTKTAELLRVQISSQQTTSIPPQKVEEFRQVFSHFDENKDNQLSRLELKSALSALGLIELNFDGTDQVFENYWHELAKGTDQVQFEDWANFMAARETTDKLDIGQVKDSFINLSGGNPYVTEDQLRVAGVDQNTIEFVTLNFQPMEGGYNFGQYLSNTFAQ